MARWTLTCRHLVSEELLVGLVEGTVSGVPHSF